MMQANYIDKLMRGNNFVRTTVGKFLYNAMPPYIDLMRAQNDDLNQYKLPYPKQYDAIDPYSSNDHTYPMVGAYFSGTGQFNRTHVMKSGASSFESEYEATFFVAAKTALLPTSSGMAKWEKPERESAIRIRDDLVAIMRACLLETPSCNTAGQANCIVIEQNSLRESYQEPVKANNQAPFWIAAGLINANIKVTETTASPILGNANTFNISTERLF